MALHEVSAADIWCMPIAAVSVLPVILALSWICSAVESLSHDTSRGHVAFSRTSCEVSPTQTESSQVQQHVVKRNDFTDSFVYPKCLLLQLRACERTVCPNLHRSKLPSTVPVTTVTKGDPVSKGLKEKELGRHAELPPKSPKIQGTHATHGTLGTHGTHGTHHGAGKWMEVADGIGRHVNPVLHLQLSQSEALPWHRDAETWWRPGGNLTVDRDERLNVRCTVHGGQVPLIAEHYSDYRL